MSPSDPSRGPSLPGAVVAGGRLEIHPTGPATIEKTRELISAAVAEAKRQGLKSLLVLAADLELAALPTTLDRYNAIADWAREGGGVVRIAIVTRAEVMDPDRFDVRLASAFGSDLFVSTSESEARAWLDAA